MNRRGFLGTLAISTIAGCSSGDQPEDGDSDDTNEDAGSSYHQIGETATVEGNDLVVEDVSVQKSVVDVDGFRILHREPDAQVILIDAQGDDPSFVPFFDGREVEQIELDGLHNDELICVEVAKAAAAETASIALERDRNIRWRLPDAMLERLANRPLLRLLEAEVVQTDGTASLRIDVENIGDRDGVFRAIVTSPAGADLDDDVSVDVPKGKTVTETFQNSIIEDWGTDYEITEIEPDTRTFGETG